MYIAEGKEINSWSTSDNKSDHWISSRVQSKINWHEWDVHEINFAKVGHNSARCKVKMQTGFGRLLCLDESHAINQLQPHTLNIHISALVFSFCSHHPPDPTSALYQILLTCRAFSICLKCSPFVPQCFPHFSLLTANIWVYLT